MKINDYFDQVYCLNLDRRPDRMERMKKRFEYFGIEFKRFSAVNGKAMSDDEYAKYKLYKKKLSKAELACTLSHKKIYEDALEKGYEKILVLEDDARFVANFLDRIQEITKFDWDFVLLGSSQLDQIPEVNNGFYHPSERTWGTFAYAIQRKCFEKILKLMENNGMYVADGYWWDYAKEHPNCFVYFPNICITEVHDSDIRNKFNQNDYNKKAKWDLIVEDII
jgi:collagen beta-1,O-galactosyltransferase